MDQETFDQGIEPGVVAETGWVHPDGTYYSCRPTKHRMMAILICQHYGYEVINPYGVPNYEKTLDSLGYVKIHGVYDHMEHRLKSVGFFTGDIDMTTRQEAVILEIAVAFREIGNEGAYNELVEEVRQWNAPKNVKPFELVDPFAFSSVTPAQAASFNKSKRDGD